MCGKELPELEVLEALPRSIKKIQKTTLWKKEKL